MTYRRRPRPGLLARFAPLTHGRLTGSLIRHEVPHLLQPRQPVAHSEFVDRFGAKANAYAAYRPTYPKELFAYLAETAPAHSLAWDCATGSGQAAVGLAERFEQVIGTDASANQIAEAVAHPRVQYLVATAESSGLRDASVDLCTVAQALHWFNLEKFYAEVRRVLVPGGVLAVWTYSAIGLDEETIDRHMQHFYSGVVGPYWPRERRLVESGYRALSFPFKDIEAPVFALQAEWSLDRLLGYVRTWSAVSRYTLERGSDPVIELDELLRALWGPPDRRRRVYWPMSLRLGRKPVNGTTECA